MCVFDNPILFGRSEGAPSTITQYEYYSPYSPDGVQKIFGTPPRIVFLHTGFPGNCISWCVFEHHTFRVLFFHTQDSRETDFSYVFLTIRLFSAVPRGRPRLGARRTRAPSTIAQYEYSLPPTPMLWLFHNRDRGFASASVLRCHSAGVCGPGSASAS